MTDNAKALILGEILKRSTPTFRARHITDITGLSRQNVYNHLTTFVRNGWLEKANMQYAIIDRDHLLNALISESQKVVGKKAFKTTLLENWSPTYLNKLMTTVVAYQVLGINTPTARAMKMKLLQEIDNSLISLRQAKRWLNEPYMAESNARKILNGQGDLGETYERMVEAGLEMPISKQEFVSEIEEILDL